VTPTPGSHGPPHLEDAELLDYLNGSIDSPRAAVISTHIKDCLLCAGHSRRLLELSIQWDQAWSTLSSTTSPGLVAALSGADLSPVEGSPEALSARLARWISKGSELAVTLALPDLHRVARYIVPQTGDLVTARSSFFPEQAMAGVTRSSQGGEALEGPVLEIPGHGPLKARIVVEIEAASCSVSVQLDRYPAALVPPLAALVNQRSGDVQVRQMAIRRKREGLVDLVADFQASPQAGELLILIEPNIATNLRL